MVSGGYLNSKKGHNLGNGIKKKKMFMQQTGPLGIMNVCTKFHGHFFSRAACMTTLEH